MTRLRVWSSWLYPPFAVMTSKEARYMAKREFEETREIHWRRCSDESLFRNTRRVRKILRRIGWWGV